MEAHLSHSSLHGAGSSHVNAVASASTTNGTWTLLGLKASRLKCPLIEACAPSPLRGALLQPLKKLPQTDAARCPSAITMMLRRGVAQFGSALALGARCRRFESCLPDSLMCESPTDISTAPQGAVFYCSVMGRRKMCIKPLVSHWLYTRLSEHLVIGVDRI